VARGGTDPGADGSDGTGPLRTGVSYGARTRRHCAPSRQVVMRQTGPAAAHFSGTLTCRFGTAVNRPSLRPRPFPRPAALPATRSCLPIMYFDQRGQLSERMRTGLQAIAYPIQLLVSSPGPCACMSSRSRPLLAARGECGTQGADAGTGAAAMRELALEQENASCAICVRRCRAGQEVAAGRSR